MSKIINKFWLTGDKFMPKLHLIQPRITYSTCGVFTKHRERIQHVNLHKHLHKNELDKARFAHDAAYSDSKDLPKRTTSIKILKDRVYKILEIVDTMDIKEH